MLLVNARAGAITGWCRWLVLVPARHRWQLEECERVSGRFTQDAGPRHKRKLGSRRVEQRSSGRVIEAGKPVLW